MNGPVVFVSGGEGGGGVLSLVRDLAPAVAGYLDIPVIHLGLVNLPLRPENAPHNYSVETLGHDPAKVAPSATCQSFLQWVRRAGPSVVMLNDVSQIEGAWSQIPDSVRLIVVLHDEAMRFRRPLIDHCASVDRVVVVADYLKGLLANDREELGRKTVAIHNGVKFPAEVRPRARPPLTNRELGILYVGGMDTLKKGVQDLPELARALKRREVPFRLTIVGGRNEKLERRCARYGVSENVDWQGRVDIGRVLQAASMADFFFLPSRCEPFGMVTVEAMGMGCIPFAYDIESGSREIIVQGECGWLLPLAEVSAVARKMDEVRRDEGLCQRLRSHAIERAREVFSVDVAARKYADLIRNVLSEPRSVFRVAEGPLVAGAAGSDVPVGRAAAIIDFRVAARSLISKIPALVQPFWRRFG